MAARQLALAQCKERVELLCEEAKKKAQDLENNNAQLGELKNQQSELALHCRGVYESYLSKRQQVLQLRATGGANSWDRPQASWPPTEATALGLSSTPAEPASYPEPPVGNETGQSRYRALYEFVARNGDEISFQPGDIIMVTESLSNEPGWLSGEVRGHTGWFPEAYVEKMDPAYGTST